MIEPRQVGAQTYLRAFHDEVLQHSNGKKPLVDVRSPKEYSGELLHMPPGTPHAVRAPEPFSMLLTLVRERPAGPGQ